MNSGDRFRALVVVWGGVVILAGITFFGKDSLNAGEVILGVLYMLTLLGGTLGLVLGPESGASSKANLQSTERASVKRKREEINLIDRMVESMDDDQRAALLRRLGVSDAETYTDHPRSDLHLTDDGELERRR